MRLPLYRCTFLPCLSIILSVTAYFSERSVTALQRAAPHPTRGNEDKPASHPRPRRHGQRHFVGLARLLISSRGRPLLLIALPLGSNVRSSLQIPSSSSTSISACLTSRVVRADTPMVAAGVGASPAGLAGSSETETGIRPSERTDGHCCHPIRGSLRTTRGSGVYAKLG